MTPEELAEVEERCRKATAGPWRQGCFRFDLTDSEEGILASFEFNSNHAADLEFCAHARTDLPAVLAEVRRLRDENETLKANALPPGFVALHRGAIEGELDRLRAEVARLREALDAAQRIVKRKADREAGREGGDHVG